MKGRVLALDFEGTAKEPRQGYPAQIGVAVMDGDAVIASAEWTMKQPRHFKTGQPTRVVDANSLAVWGMTLERLEAEGISIYEGCCNLRDFIAQHEAQWLPVVSYNISYDVECYGQMLFEGGYFDRDLYQYLAFPEVLGPRWICAYRMARLKLAANLVNFKLDDVAEFFGMARESEVHGALPDAILAGQIYYRLSEMAVARGAA